MLLEQLQVEILENERLDIGRAFGSDRVALERNVRGGEDSRLGVVDAEAFDVGQIADAAGNGDIDVILNAAGLAQ